MSIEIKLTKHEIVEALGITEKWILDLLNKSNFSKIKKLNYDEQKEFVSLFLSDDSEEYLKQMTILREFRLLIKRNEIVDKIQELSVKDIGNFAEKLVLEIAEDTNGNVELLDKIHEILNK